MRGLYQMPRKFGHTACMNSGKRSNESGSIHHRSQCLCYLWFKNFTSGYILSWPLRCITLPHVVWCSPSKIYPTKLPLFWTACHQQPNLESVTLLFHLSHTQVTVTHNCLCQHCQYKACYRKRSLIFVSGYGISGTIMVASHPTLWRRTHVLCQDSLLNTTMWLNVVKLPDLDWNGERSPV